ncbi:hypothetical protein [Microbulbifer variabilis]|uniref:hypothetical protein n=1 Tax=Microbulbifer variabilis TaxID=266805 RepID=UPI00036AA5F8|nr:hypothetical protein [Microbulbifer variabilis]
MRSIFFALLSLSLFGCGSVSNQLTTNEIGVVLANVYPENPIEIEVMSEGEILVPITGETESIGSLSFSLTAPGGNAMMSAKNSSQSIIKYDLYMVDDSGRLHYTSSCPLMPGLSVFESWSHFIPEIIVANARVLDENQGYMCQ